MKTIKTHTADRTKVTITKTINFEKIGEQVIEKRTYKGYKLNDAPYERNHWFNYKGLTFIIS